MTEPTPTNPYTTLQCPERVPEPRRKLFKTWRTEMARNFDTMVVEREAFRKAMADTAGQEFSLQIASYVAEIVLADHMIMTQPAHIKHILGMPVDEMLKNMEQALEVLESPQA